MDTKLDFIILCDKAFFGESDKKLNIIGAFDTIGALDFPANHPYMAVVVGIEITGGTHTETLKIKKDALEILKIETPFSKSEPGRHRFIHNLLNTIFPKEGEYIFEVYIDSYLIGFTKIYLKKV